jgi:hypothetical protein
MRSAAHLAAAMLVLSGERSVMKRRFSWHTGHAIVLCVALHDMHITKQQRATQLMS